MDGATKYTIGGWLTERALGKRLNGVSVKGPLPFPTVRRWRQALLRANAELLDEWQDSLRERLRLLVGGLGPAGESLLTDHYDTWLWAVAEAQITQRELRPLVPRSKRRRSKGAPPTQDAIRLGPAPLAETLHQDGSASAVHIGLTLAGLREVRFLQEAVAQATKLEVTPSIAPDVVLQCAPGHVYLGGVTGARHQVLHDDVEVDCELLQFPPGPCSLTVMMRSCVFNDYGRCQNTTPNPRNVWLTFAASVRDLIADVRLRLPTFREFEQATSQ